MTITELIIKAHGTNNPYENIGMDESEDYVRPILKTFFEEVCQRALECLRNPPQDMGRFAPYSDCVQQAVQELLKELGVI